MTTTPLKRQPRGQEPMEQKTYKLPARCTTWLKRQAQAVGMTEAHFLARLLKREMGESVDESEAA